MKSLGFQALLQTVYPAARPQDGVFRTLLKDIVRAAPTVIALICSLDRESQYIPMRAFALVISLIIVDVVELIIPLRGADLGGSVA